MNNPVAEILSKRESQQRQDQVMCALRGHGTYLWIDKTCLACGHLRVRREADTAAATILPDGWCWHCKQPTLDGPRHFFCPECSVQWIES